VRSNKVLHASSQAVNQMAQRFNASDRSRFSIVPGEAGPNAHDVHQPRARIRKSFATFATKSISVFAQSDASALGLAVTSDTAMFYDEDCELGVVAPQLDAKAEDKGSASGAAECGTESNQLHLPHEPHGADGRGAWPPTINEGDELFDECEATQSFMPVATSSPLRERATKLSACAQPMEAAAAHARLAKSSNAGGTETIVESYTPPRDHVAGAHRTPVPHQPF
jgi:hypothetical protein